MKFLVLAVLPFLAATALAVGTSAHVSWTPPTAYTDGVALPASLIKNYTVTWGTPALAVTRDTVGPVLNMDVAGLTCGKYIFTVHTNLTTGVKSVESTPVTYDTGIVCSTTPAPPLNCIVK